MRALFIIVMLITSSNLWAQEPDPSNWKPGQVLSEESTEIGNGYRLVARSQVNPPGHWEGVGHFAFMYFRDTYLCQCSANEIIISPNGHFAVFVNEKNGALTLFNSKSITMFSLSSEYIGYPYAVDWDIAHSSALIHIQNWNDEKGGTNLVDIQVDLKNGT